MPLVEELLSKYSGLVFRVAFARLNDRTAAEDIMQEVFLRFYKRGPELRDEDHEKAWFIHATVNRCKTHLSSRWHRQTVPMAAVYDESCVPGETALEVAEAVRMLPKTLRTAVYLYYYERYKTREIATMLKLSEAAVKSQLLRARKRLKELLEVKDDDYI
ncbi:MAG: sigma-70 family RNA polymerase sigma factor [Clostridia bacterium]|nr:sigma-70 family RNA polymerase sigma factor [Clostridia bacterium]